MRNIKEEFDIIYNHLPYQYGDSIIDVFNLFKQNGYEIFMVGGAVRDILLGVEPSDVDFCTNATPEQMIELCKENNIQYRETGLKHGTITIIIAGYTKWHQFEVTTYRVDGEYSDGRHPDNVEFSTHLQDDLARRDFTVNAMAMDSEYNLYDYFGGEEDLSNRVIKCVGNPADRFKEDGLRILRAVRFALCLNFAIDETTYIQCCMQISNLNNVSMERVRDELYKIIFGADCPYLLLGKYRFVFRQIIAMCNLNPSTFHYDTAYGMLYRYSYSEKENRDCATFFAGILHGEDRTTCEYFLKSLKVTNNLYDDVMMLHTYRDINVPKNVHDMRYLFVTIGGNTLDIILLQIYFELYKPIEDIIYIDNFLDRYAEDCANHIPFTVGELEVNGEDMMNIGYTGRQIGEALNNILHATIRDVIPNEKEAQIQWAKSIYEKQMGV